MKSLVPELRDFYAREGKRALEGGQSERSGQTVCQIGRQGHDTVSLRRDDLNSPSFGSVYVFMAMQPMPL